MHISACINNWHAAINQAKDERSHIEEKKRNRFATSLQLATNHTCSTEMYAESHRALLHSREDRITTTTITDVILKMAGAVSHFNTLFSMAICT